MQTAFGAGESGVEDAEAFGASFCDGSTEGNEVSYGGGSDAG